jgi:acyl carrier protein
VTTERIADPEETSMPSTIDVITEIMVDKLEIDAATIGPDVAFEVMDLDSLSLVQLALLLERRYGVSVEDWELAQAQTIEKTVALLRDKGAPV